MTSPPKGVLGIKTASGTIVSILDFRTQRWNQTVFTTIRDRQKKAVFDFYYRDEESAGWQYLDSLPLARIPPAPAGEPELSVTTKVDGQDSISLEIHDPAAPNPVRFVLQADLFGSKGGNSQEGSVPAGKIPDSPGRTAGKVRDSGVHSKTAASIPIREKGRKGRLVWLMLALAVIFLSVSVFFSNLNPVSLLQRSGGRAPGIGKAEQPARAAETPRTENPPEMTPSLRQSEPMESAASGLAAEAQQDAETANGELEHEPTSVTAGRGEREYLITWGDTLWRITERFYGDREVYPALADANRIPDPDVIIAGETLVLPPLLEEERRANSGED